MTFDFAEFKRSGRRAVHEIFRVEATYGDVVVNPARLCRVRLHNKLGLFQDLNSEGFAQTLEGIDRVVFSADELMTPEVVGLVTYGGFMPDTDGVITFVAYGGIQFRLDTLAPPDGPINVTWNVVRV